MRFEPIASAAHPMFPQAMELYRISFPYHEQREAPSQSQIMAHPDYQFNLIYHQTQFVGLILCWETADFIYVEHFCILPDMRGQRYGQRALELLHQRGKTVILEIDPPEDALSLRRKGFYQRLGYQPNHFPHRHPAYHRNCSGHRLVVMSYPAPLSQELYASFDRYLKTIVMNPQP